MRTSRPWSRRPRRSRSSTSPSHRSMAKEQRPFNREALTTHATPAVRPPIGVGAVAWRYTVLVPVEETRPGEPPRPVATEADIESLERLLFAHFGGVTVLP